MKTKLYHLTPYEKAERIMNEGLVADAEGYIFAFTDLLIANTLAKDQIFTDRYCVFRINRKGVTGEIMPDNVAEFSAPFQRIIKQKRIEAKYLKLLCEKNTIWDRPTGWDYYKGAIIGMNKAMVNGLFKQMNEYSAKSRREA